MTKNLQSKSAISMILVAVIIVIIVVASAAGAYYMTQPSTNPSASPAPTATLTISPSQTATPSASASPTAAPSVNPVVNFKVGAYAIYSTTSVTDGKTVAAQLNFTIGEDTYQGTACWTLITTAGNETSKSIIIERISKTNTSELLGNVSMQIYESGALIYEEEFDPATTSSSGIGTEGIGSSLIVGYETITVPAGTFENCAKATYKSTTAASEQTDVSAWIAQNVPVFGMVKAIETLNGTVISTLELISYGGYP